MKIEWWYSELLHHVRWWNCSDVSEERAASILRVNGSGVCCSYLYADDKKQQPRWGREKTDKTKEYSTQKLSLARGVVSLFWCLLLKHRNGVWCVRERVKVSNTAIKWFADVITTVDVFPILIACRTVTELYTLSPKFGVIRLLNTVQSSTTFLRIFGFVVQPEIRIAR